MLTETGHIVAIESEGLWVETIRQSTCGSCAAQKGCGQSLLARLAGHTSYIWVSLRGRDPGHFAVGQSITLGVPEAVIANGSLLVYLLPLVTLVLATLAAHELWANEALTTVAGLAGLLTGGAWVRWRAHVTRHDSRLQPVLIDAEDVVRLQS